MKAPHKQDLPALQVTKPPSVALPPKACDCHFHVFDAPSELSNQRLYTPSFSPWTEYLKLQKKLGIERAVIVQPSVYGTDNTTTLGILQKSSSNLRAVVSLDFDTDNTTLHALDRIGVKGVRINSVFGDGLNVEKIKRFAHKLEPFGWHIQLLVDVSKDTELLDAVENIAVPVVFDHLGHVPAERGASTDGFQRLLRLVGDGKAWVKLSGYYRLTERVDPLYPEVQPLATALLKANPERCVWGSDWPHPSITVPMPDDTQLLNAALLWLESDQLIQQVFVDNPAVLYRF